MVVDNYSIQQNAALVKSKFNQFLDISVLDYDDVVGPISELDGQVEMDGYLWPVGFVYHGVVAHSADKRDLVPMAKHTVADPVSWFVTFFVEVIRLCSHRCIVVYIKQKVKRKPTEVGFGCFDDKVSPTSEIMLLERRSHR